MMQFWTSAEAMIDIEEPLRLASNDLEGKLNEIVGREDYGAGISKWALIFIIMDEDDPGYPEVQRYKRRTRIAEFRLKVDHQSFKEADALTQRKLLAAAVWRSVELAEKLKIDDFDFERFRAVVSQTLTENKWT